MTNLSNLTKHCNGFVAHCTSIEDFKMQLEVFNAEQMDLLEIYRGRIWDSLPWSTNLPLA